jgi:hypothetical protein
MMSASDPAALNPQLSVGLPYVANSNPDVCALYGVVLRALSCDCRRASPIFNRISLSVMGCGAGAVTELRRPIMTSMPSNVPAAAIAGDAAAKIIVARPDAALGLSRSPPVPAALLSHAPVTRLMSADHAGDADAVVTNAVLFTADEWPHRSATITNTNTIC